MSAFEQGDIIMVDFSPSLGHEPQNYRPALVVSNEQFNMATSMTLVCPITSSQKRFFLHDRLPEDCLIEGSIVLEQVRALDLEARAARKVDRLPDKALERALSCLRSFF